MKKIILITIFVIFVPFLIINFYDIDEKELREEVQTPFISKSDEEFDDIDIDLPKLKD